MIGGALIAENVNVEYMIKPFIRLRLAILSDIIASQILDQGLR